MAIPQPEKTEPQTHDGNDRAAAPVTPPTRPGGVQPQEQGSRREGSAGPPSGQPGAPTAQRQGPGGPPSASSGQGPPNRGFGPPPPVKKSVPEQVRTWLAHPLLLLLLGSIVTGILVPTFTHKWQSAQTAQDMKTMVISDITTATATAMTQLEISMNPILNNGVATNSINNPGVPASYANWTRQAARASAEVGAYFPENNIPDHWGSVVYLMKNFFLLTYATDPGMRQTYITNIQNYYNFHRINLGVDWSALQKFNPASDHYRAAWTQLENAILKVRNGVTAEIMDAPAPSF